MPKVAGGSKRVPGEEQGEFVQALERGLSVIRAFGLNRVHLTVTDVAQATGLTRATARRFLHTLVQLGYVRNHGRDFSLRPRVLELGYPYLEGLTLPEVARPFMEELVARVQESSSIAVLDDEEIVYVAHAAPKRIMTINVPIGGRDPVYCTSLGRVLLAAQPDEEIDRYVRSIEITAHTLSTVTDPDLLREAVMRARDDGYSLIQGELEDGLVALAVPVRDGYGNVLAAMNISAYSLRTGPDLLEKECLPILRDTVAEIERELRAGAR